MSILIKGIDIPEKGTQRVMYITIDSTGLVELLDPDTNTLIEEYYAVQVPEPHGRLIDADVMRTKIDAPEDEKRLLVQWVDAQKTVIEAEGGE